MYIHDYEITKVDDSYEITIFIDNPVLEEFAEEFGGLTRNTESDVNRLAVGFVKRRFPDLKIKSIKVMVGGALVASIVVGGGTSGLGKAFAEENNLTQTETTTSTTAEPNQSTEVTNSETEPTDDTTATETAVEGTGLVPEEAPTEPTDDTTIPPDTEGETDEPSLIPGDFFYFVKTLSEKVQLALTFDDVEKAKLLSAFANERIAEANALLAAGDTEGAIELLNTALENQELSLDYSDEVLPEDTTAEGEQATEGTTPEEPLSIEDEANLAEEPEESATEVQEELETQFSKNLTALLLALEKVENPKAKAALTKNVEKAYARMESKLGKMQEIEERLTNALPVEEEVEELRDDIASDQEDFDSSMAEIEETEESAEAGAVVPPVVPKKAGEKTNQGKAYQNNQSKQQTQERSVSPKSTEAQKPSENKSPKANTNKGNANGQNDTVANETKNSGNSGNAGKGNSEKGKGNE